MTIVFLYSELMPNLLILFKALIRAYSAQIHVVYWDHRKKTPFVPGAIDGVTFYKRSAYGYKEIKDLMASLQPDAIYVVGWMDYTYLRVLPTYRRRGVPILVGFDDWWRGTFRQTMARYISPILTKVLFSHAWIAGQRQYEYAKRLGFKDKFIVPNLLTCDTDLFDQGYQALQGKRGDYPKVFLYVGRYSPEKGTVLLAEGFEKYRTKYKGDWKLVCVGNGPLRNALTNKPNIELHEFTSQADVVQEMVRAGVFVVPSLRDFSPLVVHEAACSGMPMVLSSNVGNIPLFLINNYNGIVFDSGSSDAMALALHRISNKPVDELILMGERSHQLSRRINPEISAASFVSSITR